MTIFMSNFVASNLRFAPQPQAGSKSRVICFCSAGRLRFISASETVRERVCGRSVAHERPVSPRTHASGEEDNEPNHFSRESSKSGVGLPGHQLRSESLRSLFL